MTNFERILSMLKDANYNEKQGIFDYFLNALQHGLSLNKEDKNLFTDYAEKELTALQATLSQIKSYKEKDPLLVCSEALLTALVMVFPTPDLLPAGLKTECKDTARILSEERYIEHALNKMFSQQTLREDQMERLILSVKETDEEYQKGRLYAGLHHYRGNFSILSEKDRTQLSDFMTEEMKRYLATSPREEDSETNLELLADLCKHFPQEDTEFCLRQMLSSENRDILYYATESLLALNKQIPEEPMKILAKDLVSASMTYQMLQNHGVAYLFPEEYTDEIYLAKSDMIHWLTFPTELGQVPDDIEYLGKVKKLFSKEVFHVFRFRSNSDTLGEELKYKWLIGWSSNDGGTFSEFEEYTAFEQDTPQKTLKAIRKRILG
ncbi:MAG: hypothetical protein IJC19_04940 [Clostridia bacterium]|nr:hypothetical protein [Clostridia bacterium]